MARRRQIPKYGTVVHNGITYYRTRIRDADGKRVALYRKTREELYDMDIYAKVKHNRPKELYAVVNGAQKEFSTPQNFGSGEFFVCIFRSKVV